MRRVRAINTDARGRPAVRYTPSSLGVGTKHDGQRYEVHLCERCFFGNLAYIKQEQRVLHMFDKVESADVDADDIGLAARDDFFCDLPT